MRGKALYTPEITIVHPAPAGDEDADMLSRSEWPSHTPFTSKRAAVRWVEAELPKHPHAISGRVLKTFERDYDFEEEVFYTEAI